MWKWLAIAVGTAVVLVIAGKMLRLGVIRSSTWQQLTSPGPLSKAHAFIGDNCAACHTSAAGATSAKCVACHANNPELLQRQPTAFHATISECSACHYEHSRGVERPIHMDHAALARIGLAELGRGSVAEKQNRTRLLDWLRSGSVIASKHALSSPERLLNCVSCHQVQDVHKGNFGENCASCHGTKNWFIAGYVHPSPSTRQCAQCHTASPCHFMEGCLGMMGKMAGGEGARLEQCYFCHKTTNWYDFQKRTGGHH
jgi:hypothetical protein